MKWIRESLPVVVVICLAVLQGPTLPLADAVSPPASGLEGSEPQTPWSGSTSGCQWVPGFHIGDVDGAVYAMAEYDDGTGPALYVAGSFNAAGLVAAHNIARWDGRSWHALRGSNGEEILGLVHALAVYDDGTGPALYAGGAFSMAGGLVVNHVARWDGHDWSALSGPSGTGIDSANGNTVYALAAYQEPEGPALFVGGFFASAGGVATEGIARWNGDAWSWVNSTAPNNESIVSSFAVWDDGTGPALYATGSFSEMGGSTASGIARWDGLTWSALPSGGISSKAMVALPGALYTGGSGVAQWDGTEWSTLEGPSGQVLDGSVYSLGTVDTPNGPALVAGGAFESAGDVVVNNVAVWDGTAWSALEGPSGIGADRLVMALTGFDDGSGPSLYLGGWFRSVGGIAARGVARWRGADFTILAGTGQGVDGPVSMVEPITDSEGSAVYVSGQFAHVGTLTEVGLARWDGHSWKTLGANLARGRSVSAVVSHDDGSGPEVWFGGEFEAIGGVDSPRLARRVGTTWLPAPGPTGDFDKVITLAIFDGGDGERLFAGGLFTSIGGQVVNNIARRDGTEWQPLKGNPSPGTDGYVFDLTVFDDGGGADLYVAGSFYTAGDEVSNCIAGWDGLDWFVLDGPSGTGVEGSEPRIYALTTFDDGEGPALYAGGYFQRAGGLTASNIARWDGLGWAPLVGPEGGEGTDGMVFGLGVFDDGSGPGLYVGGYFATAGGTPAHGIARWDGTTWSAVNSGLWDVRAMTTFDAGGGPSLVLGGNFATAGNLASSYIAVWSQRWPHVFANGFESGTTSAWSMTVP